MEHTIAGLLSGGNPRGTALTWDDDGEPRALTYAGLREMVERLAGQLRGLGIHPNDRVGIVLPNGPGAALAFLGASAAATAAPINPALKSVEIETALIDLQARAVLLAPGATPFSVPAGVQVVELASDGASFRLESGGHPLPAKDAGAPSPRDIALVLQTSGTTAKPKTVPLSHANLTASAANIAATLALREGDRCLNVMPLFHIHGLVGALLSSLTGGASVACTGGFDPFSFFQQVTNFRPTWYTAVPTIHQVVAERAARSPGVLQAARLRFVRSSSSALPTAVLDAIESLTSAPMVEAYGMTEASHQMASNPLPPGARKPSSVGVGGAVELAILDAAGRHCAFGERGEAAIRGASVFSGYHNNAEANAAAFSDGWFRTGDEGYLDRDDYLFLTGRIKELINRGGEKVAPAEVEDVLLRHAAIAEAVVFSVPHRRLGEEVGAAVVLRPGHDTAEKELREHLSRNLADFKVPRTVHVVAALPKGPTGKLQRIGMAARLGILPDEAAGGPA